MITLLVGLSVVAVSAVGFWLVLFNHPATQSRLGPSRQRFPTAVAETTPRSHTPTTQPLVRTHTKFRRGIPVGAPAMEPGRRIRSTLILGLATIGTAALLGAVLSVFVVVAVLVVT
ncbi:MAG: hypothetical protein WBA45_05135 [Microthrixaceae bacterium]